jgi:hypothetical protein
VTLLKNSALQTKLVLQFIEEQGACIMFTDLQQETSTFYYRYREDGIHEFSFRAMTQIEIDNWSEIARRIKPTVVENRLHLCSLYRLTGVTPNAYTIRNAMQIINHLPKTLPVSTAMLLDGSSITTIIAQMFLRQLPVRALQARQIFFQEEDALHWLAERRKLLG